MWENRSHTAIERLPVLGEEGRNDPAFSELGRDAEPAVQVASTAPVRLSQNGCTSSRPSQFRVRPSYFDMLAMACTDHLVLPQRHLT